MIESGGFIYKSKGGIRSRNNGPLRRGQKALTGNNCCRSENSGSLRLGELTITWKRD